MPSRLAARRKYGHMCTPAVSSSRMTCLEALSSASARLNSFNILRMRLFVTHPLLRRHNMMFGGRVGCKLDKVAAGNVCSLPSRICGRRGWMLESSHIIAICVKPPLFCFRLTFCTKDLLRLEPRLRARSWAWLPLRPLRCWQCNVIRVSSMLMRRGGLDRVAAVSSAMFHNDHAAEALKCVQLQTPKTSGGEPKTGTAWRSSFL